GSTQHKYLRAVWYRIRSGSLSGAPRLTLLLPIDRDETTAALDASVASLFAQDDPRWELILVGEAAAGRRARLAPVARITTFTGSGDAAAQLTAAAAEARGDFVAVVAAGDELLPAAVR